MALVDDLLSSVDPRDLETMGNNYLPDIGLDGEPDQAELTKRELDFLEAVDPNNPALFDWRRQYRTKLMTGDEKTYTDAEGNVYDEAGNKIIDATKDGNEANTDKGNGNGDGDGGGGNFGTTLGQAASLAIPGYIAARNFLSETDGPFKPDFKNVQFTTPTVRGLAAPRFTTRFRRAMGSSLAEREGGLRFADAQNEARRQQYMAQNDQFIMGQEQRNAQTLNRESMINTQIDNREIMEGIGENRRQQERKESMANNALSAFTSNLSNLINQRTLGDAEIAAFAFEEDVRKGKGIDEAMKKNFGRAGRRVSRTRDNYRYSD